MKNCIFSILTLFLILAYGAFMYRYGYANAQESLPSGKVSGRTAKPHKSTMYCSEIPPDSLGGHQECIFVDGPRPDWFPATGLKGIVLGPGPYVDATSISLSTQ